GSQPAGARPPLQCDPRRGAGATVGAPLPAGAPGGCRLAATLAGADAAAISRVAAVPRLGRPAAGAYPADQEPGRSGSGPRNRGGTADSAWWRSLRARGWRRRLGRVPPGVAVAVGVSG